MVKNVWDWLKQINSIKSDPSSFSDKDWDKLHLITMILVKLTRIVNAMNLEKSHKDSTRDLVVYAAMLDSLED